MSEEGVDALFAPARRTGKARSKAPDADDGVGSLFAPVRRTDSRQASRQDSRESPKKGRIDQLSRLYAEAHKLGYNDKIHDGFCDIEAEKVLIDRDSDQTLSAFLQRAHTKLQKASDPVTAVMVLALIISEFCGGSGTRATGLEARFKARLQECRKSDGKILLGSLFGEQAKKKKLHGCAMAQHRALAFKASTDVLDTPPCTLERDPLQMIAWNIVHFNQVSYVVDLMHDPGALYEASSPKYEEYLSLLAPGLFESQTMTISIREELEGRVPRPPWHVEAADLDICKDRLGKGGFGDVYKATWSGIDVAVKVVRDKDLSDYDVLNFMLEIALLSRLNHPNVMRLWRGCVQLEDGKQCLLMVTEYIEKGDLSMLLHGNGGPALPEALTLPQVVWLSVGIARGLQYLHVNQVLHMDLKSPNVLIDGDWIPKLCDFGLAKITDAGENFQTTLRGASPVWAPPEMFDDQADVMTEKADVYSFGIVFFELVTKQLPFQEIAQRNLPKAKWEGVLPEIPAAVSEQCITLITVCCARRPSFRPSMSGVVSRIGEIASKEGIDLANVVMPSWKGPLDPSRDRDALQCLQSQQEELLQERDRLASQLSRAQSQRSQLQHCFLGKPAALASALASIEEVDADLPAEEAIFKLPNQSSAGLAQR